MGNYIVRAIYNISCDVHKRLILMDSTTEVKNNNTIFFFHFFVFVLLLNWTYIYLLFQKFKLLLGLSFNYYNFFIQNFAKSWHVIYNNAYNTFVIILVQKKFENNTIFLQHNRFQKLQSLNMSGCLKIIRAVAIVRLNSKGYSWNRTKKDKLIC